MMWAYMNVMTAFVVLCSDRYCAVVIPTHCRVVTGYQLNGYC